jgi:hypothetical protein
MYARSGSSHHCWWGRFSTFPVSFQHIFNDTRPGVHWFLEITLADANSELSLFFPSIVGPLSTWWFSVSISVAEPVVLLACSILQSLPGTFRHLLLQEAKTPFDRRTRSLAVWKFQSTSCHPQAINTVEPIFTSSWNLWAWVLLSSSSSPSSRLETRDSRPFPPVF